MDNIELYKLFTGRTILQGMPEIAYVFNKEGKLLLWNKNVETVLGYSKEELYKKNIIDFQDINDRKRIKIEFVKVFTKGEERKVEYNLITKSGRKIPCLGTGSLAVVNGVEYLIGIAIDISKLKTAEEKLIVQLNEINQLKDQLQTENIYLKDLIKNNPDFEDIIGQSKNLLNFLGQIKQVSTNNTPVILTGETGTKIELYAKTIHDLSSRKNKPFVKINCITLQNKNIETEFFGQIKNDINGDKLEYIGKLEMANTGTLYIEEVSEIPLSFQSKLLKIIKEKKFSKLGSSKMIPLDVRVVTSTNRNLVKLIKKKKFLKDLFFYINVFPISIPALRERYTDIPLIVESLVFKYNIKFNKKINKTPRKTMLLLQNYSWPGNDRELENIIERAVIITNTSILKVDQFMKSTISNKEKSLTLHDFERKHIIKILDTTFWQVSGEKGAAKILDIHPETLRSRMRKLNIKRI